MTSPWLTSCWMIRSWQPPSTGSGRSWTLCWFRTSITSSRTPRLPQKAPRRAVRAHILLPPSKILFENKPEFSIPSWLQATLQDAARAYIFFLKRKTETSPSSISFLSKEAAQVRTSTHHSRTPASGHRASSKLEWLSPAEWFSFSCQKLTGMPGSRCHVRTLSSVPCSQENDDVLWTKDHFFFFF